jgi:hypothetical protein
MLKALGTWFDETVLDFGRQLRLSYLPPLMVYLAAGISSSPRSSALLHQGLARAVRRVSRRARLSLENYL